MKVTKQKAAEIVLDAAINAFFNDEWIPTIHLAGAAEEIFGRLEEANGGVTVPDFLWTKTVHKELFENKQKKGYIKSLNFFRDWIKHINKEHPAEVEIQYPDVIVALMRAIHSHETHTNERRDSVNKFLAWYQENKKQLHEIVEEQTSNGNA